jgi:uncharacterized protein YqeY
MAIKEKVESGMKEAMKNKEQERLSALRMIKAEFLLKEKEAGKTLDDVTADQALRSMLKKYKKAKEEYESLGKHEEAAHYERDMKIIESFMSTPMMDDAQTKQALQSLVSEMNAASPKDFGKVMKAFMSQYPGADGKVVSSLLKEILK